eukprot:sb/3476856/
MIHADSDRSSDPDLPGPDISEPRFTGRMNFPRYRKLTAFYPDIPGTPIYRAKSFPPRIPVNRGPTRPTKIKHTIQPPTAEFIFFGTLSHHSSVWRRRPDLSALSRIKWGMAPP